MLCVELGMNESNLSLDRQIEYFKEISHDTNKVKKINSYIKAQLTPQIIPYNQKIFYLKGLLLFIRLRGVIIQLMNPHNCDGFIKELRELELYFLNYHNFLILNKYIISIMIQLSERMTRQEDYSALEDILKGTLLLEMICPKLDRYYNYAVTKYNLLNQPIEYEIDNVLSHEELKFLFENLSGEYHILTYIEECQYNKKRRHYNGMS